MTVTFVGTPDGDMECFMWSDVPVDERAANCSSHDFDVEHGERLDVLYPNDVMDALGCEGGKKYRFTITAEPVTGD